jgi:hypothetical protein
VRLAAHGDPCTSSETIDTLTAMRFPFWTVAAGRTGRARTATDRSLTWKEPAPVHRADGEGAPHRRSGTGSAGGPADQAKGVVDAPEREPGPHLRCVPANAD